MILFRFAKTVEAEFSDFFYFSLIFSTLKSSNYDKNGPIKSLMVLKESVIIILSIKY